VFRDKARLLGAMRDQDMLHSVHALYLGCLRIYPIDLIFKAPVHENLLVHGTKITAQINPPILVVLSPPIKVNMEARLKSWLDKANPLDFRQSTPPD
jgi:hypothetical protein